MAVTVSHISYSVVIVRFAAVHQSRASRGRIVQDCGTFLNLFLTTSSHTFPISPARANDVSGFLRFRSSDEDHVCEEQSADDRVSPRRVSAHAAGADLSRRAAPLRCCATLGHDYAGE
jgi:hypothetical protein